MERIKQQTLLSNAQTSFDELLALIESIPLRNRKNHYNWAIKKCEIIAEEIKSNKTT
ncbi:hypothetical protein OR571_04540 [Psychrobacillus sp. NEAU-3TGS]|uniref:hypothetical protein n=1 Tax=Psychrobacillus sp. NEAU-3TGS TaxID=2995412 RepID=UPI002498CB82|nr:hypothetical protein [Psychrobacillus sp. NEAU-3TGS]MDI2586417.1 hypothetical protein [Psychrobacillus sp. NEAU-3TGS]